MCFSKTVIFKRNHGYQVGWQCLNCCTYTTQMKRLHKRNDVTSCEITSITTVLSARNTKILPTMIIIEMQAIQIVNKSLAKEVVTLQNVCSTQQKELQMKDDKLKNLEQQYKPHNVRRRLKRKDTMIEKQKEQIKQQAQELKKTQQVVTKKLQDQLRYYKQKSAKVESDTSDSECEYCSELEDQIQQLQEENTELLEENAVLNEELCQLKSQSLITMVDGKYTEEVRLCVMELLALNVGINKVEPVIRAVLKLANVSCPQLPQHTAISDMLLEARALSQIQLAETLSVTEDNTLHSDGTTKFGQKYTSYQISTNDKALTLGVQVLDDKCITYCIPDGFFYFLITGSNIRGCPDNS